MNTESNLTSGLDRFAKYAWFALAYNIVVILWGVFLRASKSGDGCGQHWLTCHGEVVPSAPELKTVIEFSHRLTSGLAFVVVLALLIWAFRMYGKGHPVRKTALISFIFIIVEAVIGGLLVLTGNTAETLTTARPFWMAGHLIITFILSAFLSLTAWLASGGRFPESKAPPKVLFLLLIAVVGICFVGMSGSIAALSSMLFPSATIMEGIAQDFSASSNILVRLRIIHPILSVLISFYLIFLAGWLKAKSANNPSVVRWANILSGLIFVQIIWGGVTLLSLAPIVMQIVHLFLADAVWIALILMSANFLSVQGKAPQTAIDLERRNAVV